MSIHTPTKPTPLRQAVLRCASPQLVEAILAAECRCSDAVLAEQDLIRLGDAEPVPAPNRTALKPLLEAWEAVFSGWRSAMAAQGFRVTGWLGPALSATQQVDIPPEHIATGKPQLFSGELVTAEGLYSLVMVHLPNDEAEPIPQPLPLKDAVLRWCDPALVAAVRDAERARLNHELDLFYLRFGNRWRRLTTRNEAAKPTGTSWMAGGTDYSELTAAWQALAASFQSTVAHGFLVHGTQTKPTLSSEPETIPAAWLSDAELEIGRSAIAIGNFRFANVTVLRAPAIPIGAADDGTESHRAHAMMPATPGGIPPITAENYRDLSDDEVLLLLEEHARRVIRSPDAKLIAPGKISLMPIIKHKMIARADDGDILTSLAAESRFLAQWIADKVSHHQTPTEGTISKVLGKDYAIEKARSNAAFQKLKG